MSFWRRDIQSGSTAANSVDNQLPLNAVKTRYANAIGPGMGLEMAMTNSKSGSHDEQMQPREMGMGMDLLHMLPLVTVHAILEYFTAAELCRMAPACRQWCELMSSPALWTHLNFAAHTLRPSLSTYTHIHTHIHTHTPTHTHTQSLTQSLHAPSVDSIAHRGTMLRELNWTHGYVCEEDIHSILTHCPRLHTLVLDSVDGLQNIATPLKVSPSPSPSLSPSPSPSSPSRL